MENTKKKVSVQLMRKDGKTVFSFEIDENIEKMYRNQAEANGEIRDSANWPGLKFYYLPAILRSPNYKSKLANALLIDDFGQAIVYNGHFNIAWLRTVTGKGQVVINNDSLSFAELSIFIKSALSFVKEYFDEYYRGFTIKGNVSVEI